MNEDQMNYLLGRQQIEKEITDILQTFETQIKNVSFKKGIYLYGSSGSGKTYFINTILKKLNYDIIRYDSGDTRNKNLINSITNDNLSNNNVLNMFYRKKQKTVIVMDEIEAMNSGDKGGITALIKLIRQKKTKRQKLEIKSSNPIICIGNYYIDKKIKELMKVCHIFELKTLTNVQSFDIFKSILPETIEPILLNQYADFCQGNLHKIFSIIKWSKKNVEWVNQTDIFESGSTNILRRKIFNDDSKKKTQYLLENSIELIKHNELINETDRTIVALLWHENIVDCFKPFSLAQKNIKLYYILLRNICFADYIDRITFQNQIWQFNEMSSLIKTIYNNKIFHENCKDFQKIKEVRFTKILTKYSTEYNNFNFLYNLCNCLDMDKKDVFSFFKELRIIHGPHFYNDENHKHIQKSLEFVNISKLDIVRIYRYLDQTEKKNAKIEEIIDLDEESEDDNDEI